MKESIKKISKIVGILTAILIIACVGIYFNETKTVANNREYRVVTESYVSETETEAETTVEATTVVEAETTVETTTEVEAETTVEATTEAETETTVEATTVVEVETTVEATTVVEMVTEEVTVPVIDKNVAVPAIVEFTEVVFKDSENTYEFSSLSEAKENINVPVLSSDEAKKVANDNKVEYAEHVKELVDMINSYRKTNGLKKLTINDNLINAAMHRAAENAYSDWNMTAKENGTKRHIRPNFEKAATIKDEYGITGNFGENFGRYQGTTTEILEGWQASSSHNALLLGEGYNEIGIGVAADSEGYLYWIALFN